MMHVVLEGRKRKSRNVHKESLWDQGTKDRTCFKKKKVGDRAPPYKTNKN